MPESRQPDDVPVRGTGAQFAPTQWTVVLAAKDGFSPEAQVALTQLCQSYWYPLYAFIRRRGHPPHEAQDLTQDFFAFLLEKGALQSVDREKGRFRSFLLAAAANFLNSEWRRRTAQKRGGRHEIVSLDELLAEERYGHEPADAAAAETLFERRWACTLVEQATAQLRADYAAANKEEVFAALHGFLTGETSAGTCAEAAERLRMTEGAVKVALHRLRRRFGELLRGEIARTVARPEDVDDELRHLFAALAE